MQGPAAAMAACALVACSGATPEPQEPTRRAAVLAPPSSVARPRLVIHHDPDTGSMLRLRRIRVWLDEELIYLRTVTSDDPPPRTLLFDDHVLAGLHQVNVDLVFDARRAGCMGGWYWSRGAVRMRAVHRRRASA